MESCYTFLATVPSSVVQLSAAARDWHAKVCEHVIMMCGSIHSRVMRKDVSVEVGTQLLVTVATLVHQTLITVQTRTEEHYIFLYDHLLTMLVSFEKAFVNPVICRINTLD